MEERSMPKEEKNAVGDVADVADVADGVDDVSQEDLEKALDTALEEMHKANKKDKVVPSDEEDDEGEEVEGLKSDIEELEKLTKYTGKYDEKGAILNFFAGAGGDDAQDWTKMLLRMYIKWAENSGFSAKVIDQSKGGVAGIKNAILEIDGRYTYGKLKNENGVHRLVRQSPFNSKNLRQTSFSLVEVLPKIDEKDKNIELPENDLRVDTFRASGHGGQSVNTTDSAVRITHIPTNTIVTCQNEKSQLQNKLSAMSVLKSRLAKLLEDQHKEKISEIRGEVSEPEWGSQIRSYVLHRYKQVKDHRTDFQTSNTTAVMDGDLDGFIEAYLRKKAEMGKS